MACLNLNLKGEYFDAIKSGEKRVEYRLYNKYWRKRLLDGVIFKKWDKIIIKKGYPKSNDHTRQIMRQWKGARIETIIHPHFGERSVKVFAIIVDSPVLKSSL